MSDRQLLEDPTNRVVSVFDDRRQADEACQELAETSLSDEEIRVIQGKEAAENVDTSPKWFADTDVDIKRYQRALDEGNTVLSVLIADSASREKVHTILKRHDARLITHFGKWMTEIMN